MTTTFTPSIPPSFVIRGRDLDPGEGALDLGAREEEEEVRCAAVYGRGREAAAAAHDRVCPSCEPKQHERVAVAVTVAAAMRQIAVPVARVRRTVLTVPTVVGGEGRRVGMAEIALMGAVRRQYRRGCTGLGIWHWRGDAAPHRAAHGDHGRAKVEV